MYKREGGDFLLFFPFFWLIIYLGGGDFFLRGSAAWLIYVMIFILTCASDKTGCSHVLSHVNLSETLKVEPCYNTITAFLPATGSSQLLASYSNSDIKC